MTSEGILLDSDVSVGMIVVPMLRVAFPALCRMPSEFFSLDSESCIGVGTIVVATLDVGLLASYRGVSLV
jgi:hypothetical protein